MEYYEELVHDFKESLEGISNIFPTNTHIRINQYAIQLSCIDPEDVDKTIFATEINLYSNNDYYGLDEDLPMSYQTPGITNLKYGSTESNHFINTKHKFLSDFSYALYYNYNPVSRLVKKTCAKFNRMTNYG